MQARALRAIADHIDADERHDLDTTSLAQKKRVRVSSFGTPPGGADNKVVVIVNENTTEHRGHRHGVDQSRGALPWRQQTPAG